MSSIDFDECIDLCKSEDFDGHTEFPNLDAEQRLAWLSHISRFVSECGGAAQKSHKDD